MLKNIHLSENYILQKSDYTCDHRVMCHWAGQSGWAVHGRDVSGRFWRLQLTLSTTTNSFLSIFFMQTTSRDWTASPHVAEH